MSLDLQPGIYHGALVEVVEAEGTGLVGDHASGATVLNVASGGFRTAGQCRVNGATYAYVREGDALTITPGLLAAADDGTPVKSLTPAGEPETRKLAVVDLDMLGEEDDTGNEDANLPRAEIPGEWSGFYSLGAAAAGTFVDVEDTTYGYRVKGRPTDAPLLDAALLDPETTVPVTALTDGLPPASATTVTPIGGIGSMFYRWTEVANDDPVTYRLYVRAGASPAAPTVLATNLVTNPSFETGATGWAAISGSTAPVASTDHAWVGTQSMKCVRGAGTNVALARRSNFTTLLPGAGTYRIAVHVWVDPVITGNAGIRLSGTGVGATQNVYTAVRSGWDEVAITFTWDGVGTAFFDIADASITAGAIIYADGLILTAGSGVVSYFSGDTPDAPGIQYDWTGTPNASTSTMSSVSINPAFQVVAGVGLTSASVRKLADGTAIVADGSVTYYALVTVEDADGVGPASVVVTGIPAQVNTADIAVNAITADHIQFNTLSGETVTGLNVQTAATGKRTRFDLDDFTFYSGDPDETAPAIFILQKIGSDFRFELAGTSAAGAQPFIQLVTNVVGGVGTSRVDISANQIDLPPIDSGSIGTGTFRDSLDARIASQSTDATEVTGLVNSVAPTVTMTSGAVGTGAFRDSVDARADARAAALNTWATSWTPTWTAATTNPALGNGTLVGRFSQVGKVVRFYIELTMGSTTTFGTGAWRFDLPVAEVASRFACLGNAFDTSATDDWPLHLVRSASDQLSVKCDSTTAGGPVRGVTGLVPFAWAAGDVFYVSGTYEAA